MSQPEASEHEGHPETAASKSWKNATTIKDVARAAGLSAMTVSRALNSPQYVRPETIRKVQEAIEQTGYIPNLLAGGLVSKRSRLIAALVPQLNNAMFVDTIQSLGEQLSAQGYQLFLGMAGHPTSYEDELVSTILSRRPDGIVLTGVNHTSRTRQKLQSAGIPVVEIWDLTSSPIDMVVGFSHEKVGQTIAQHLLEKGYRRFAMVCAGDERGTLRQKGLTNELARHGISDMPVSIVPVPSNLAYGRQGLASLFDAGHRPEVVVCTTDAYALGVEIEAQSRGLVVPDELAIMGFGDLDLSASANPAISTVHIDKKAIGTLAAKALIARIEGRPQASQIIDVGFKLIERAST